MTVIKNGVSVTAVRATSGQSAMGIQVSVDDAKVRSQLDGFDGMERPFALVPYQHGSGPVEWRRVNLGYETTDYDSKSHSLKDEYAAQSIDMKDNVADKLGVVIGMETNEGTVWAQNYGETYHVKDAGEP
jgi:hypothetical protein